MLPGGEHGPDQRLGPGDDVGLPGDQRQQEQARVQLAGVVAQLADMALVQRPPGRVGEHVPVAELAAYLLRPPPQLTEWPVLRLAERRDRAGQADPGRVARIAGLEGGLPFGDREHGQRRALRILQDHVTGVRRDGVGGHLERYRHRPGRAVDQQAALGDRRRVGRIHEAAQRREHPRSEQLQIRQLRLTECVRWPVRELRGQSGGYLSSQLGLRGSLAFLSRERTSPGQVGQLVRRRSPGLAPQGVN